MPSPVSAHVTDVLPKTKLYINDVGYERCRKYGAKVENINFVTCHNLSNVIC